MNIDTGEIRPWASLTEAERTSGRWIPLPDKDENGVPILAKQRSMLEEMNLPQERIGNNGRTYRLNTLGQYERVR